ncbi:MAG: hypothetical protein ACJ760_02985, partial [Thermoleophilaceae bacterium]
MPVKGKRRAKVRHACRGILLRTLREAAKTVAKRQGSANPAKWKLHATCEQTDPPKCDQLVPSTAGAVDTPPFPWQNRGTYHQVDEIPGHR